MNRRGALACLLGASWLAARAQKPARPRRIGVLNDAGGMSPEWIRMRIDSLSALGWTPGSFTLIERTAAADLVREALDVIITEGTARTVRLSRATTRIPIVTGVADPVAAGLARSLRASGTNVTGLAWGNAGETLSKELEYMRAIVPGLGRIGRFSPRSDALPRATPGPGTSVRESMIAAAAAHGLAMVECPYSDEAEMAQALDGLRGKPPAMAHSMTGGDEEVMLARLALERRVPVAVGHPDSVKAGGLLSFVRYFDPDVQSRFAVVVDKVLRGADPATLPFEEPTRSHLAINLKTARALGLVVPREIVVRADLVF